jgi:hypothetical protein
MYILQHTHTYTYYTIYIHIHIYYIIYYYVCLLLAVWVQECEIGGYMGVAGIGVPATPVHQTHHPHKYIHLYISATIIINGDIYG